MGAFSPASDHFPLLAQAGIDDFIVHVLAEWAAQFFPPEKRKVAFGYR
jgi:hypothetical protein